jgi:hypothetical protein
MDGKKRSSHGWTQIKDEGAFTADDPSVIFLSLNLSVFSFRPFVFVFVVVDRLFFICVHLCSSVANDFVVAGGRDGSLPGRHFSVLSFSVFLSSLGNFTGAPFAAARSFRSNVNVVAGEDSGFTHTGSTG